MDKHQYFQVSVAHEGQPIHEQTIRALSQADAIDTLKSDIETDYDLNELSFQATQCPTRQYTVRASTLLNVAAQTPEQAERRAFDVLQDRVKRGPDHFEFETQDERRTIENPE